MWKLYSSKIKKIKEIKKIKKIKEIKKNRGSSPHVEVI